MNRRDMIIAAALINVGLLVVLVITSIKKEDKEATIATHTTVSDLELPVTLSPSLPKREKRELPSPVTKSIPTKKKAINSAAAAIQEKKSEGKRLVSTPLKVKPAKEQMRMIEVKKGDVLEKIAKTHEVTVEEIMRLNGLTTTRLQIGQHLKIPPIKSKPRLPLKQKAEGKYHVVREGENPWTIAKQYHMKVEDLLRLNKLTQEEAKKLRPGRELKVE